MVNLNDSWIKQFSSEAYRNYIIYLVDIILIYYVILLTRKYFSSNKYYLPTTTSEYFMVGGYT